MSNIQQKGIGLVEVMVSLLLLAVAVLGFSALQMQAVSATDESLVRTRATSVISSLAEAMRENVGHLPAMQKVLDTSTPKADIDAIPNCLSITCTPEQMAQYAAKEVKNQADTEGFKVGMAVCPGTAKTAGSKKPRELYCAIIAWGDTEAAMGSSDNDCVSTSGVYNEGSTCLIMETY